MANLRRHSGRIVYSKQGDTVGWEQFDIDVRGNGRTIRAYCEMDEGALTRDASWTLDADHWPTEAHVRVVQHGELVGSSWYHLDGTQTECESVTQLMGRSSQRLPGRARYLGLHPLIGDGMIALARGRDAPGQARTIDSVTCSYDINGESSLVALPIGIDVTYVGTEAIAVPAGRFDADCYELRWQPHWPAARLWVHGEDALFLRLTWEYSELDCELVEVSTREQPAG